MTTANRLILIDGSSFLFRAYHAVPPLTNASGLSINAVYGVANMLRKLIKSYKSEYFTVVFDAKGKNFRHELYPEYKANRPAMPADLVEQIQPLHALIRCMGLPLIMHSGVEADDVLGALAQQAEAQGFQVVIATGDKDMAQLVNENISLENSMSNTKLDVQGVIDKFGVRPNQIIDYLALMGDSSDNIPGIPKVGAKTAAKWLAKYGDIVTIMARAEEITGKVGESLRTNFDQLLLSQQLTTIKTDLNLGYSMDDLKSKPADLEALKVQVATLGLKTWLKELNALPIVVAIPEQIIAFEPPAEIVETELKPKYETILTQQQWDVWLLKLKQAHMFAFDTETTSLNYTEAKIVGLSFATEVGVAAYLPLMHDYPNVPTQLNLAAVLASLQAILEDPKKFKVGQNLKYDAHVLANHGIQLRGIQDDSMLASYVLNSVATKHNLDDLAQHYLHIKTIHYADVAGKGVKQIPFAQVELELASEYAAEDADISLRLQEFFTEELTAIPKLNDIYRNLELPLLSILKKIESHGVLLDCEFLAQQSLELASEIQLLEQQAHDLAGHTFNLNSPKQIGEILYIEQEMPVLKKTPKGQASTAEVVLQELALNYPLPKLILTYRHLSKLKSTYTDTLPQQVNPNTGRVHTSYNQAGTATGRLSSSNPNFQHIPIRTAIGRKIRQAFIAPKGYKIVAADYSQIELRIMAHLSQDENLLTAFATGKDIHTATAAEVFNLELNAVDMESRRAAKAINFGLIYGMSAFGLSQKLGVERKQAQAYIDLYFQRYPKVKIYMDNIRAIANKHGYVETLLGRRLYVPEINSRNAHKRQAAERTAINAALQGTAADIIKLAMLATDKWLQQEQPQVKMLMQVHDELVFEVAITQLDSACEKINQYMSAAMKLDVPLVVEVGVGNNWDEAH